jgi:hypothetical protein
MPDRKVRHFSLLSSRFIYRVRCHAIGDGLGKVNATDNFLPVKIGQRSRDLQHTVIGARRERVCSLACCSNEKPGPSGFATCSIKATEHCALVVIDGKPNCSWRRLWILRASATRSATDTLLSEAAGRIRSVALTDPVLASLDKPF